MRFEYKAFITKMACGYFYHKVITTIAKEKGK